MSHNSLFVIHYSRYVLMVLIFVVSLFMANDASAGMIIKAPAYLGLNTGLVGCWSFDGSYAKVPDCSGNNNTGTMSGATKITGKIGQALDFDGVDDITTINDNGVLNITGDYSTSVWVRLVGVQSDFGAIYTKTTDGSSNAYSLQFQQSPNNNLYVYHDNTEFFDTLITRTDLQDSRWHHIIITRSGTTQASYLDGVRKNQATFATSPSSGAGILKIGAERLSTYFITGRTDDLRIYNRTLSANEIKRLYLIGLGSTANRLSINNSLQNGFIGHWTFDAIDMGLSGTRAKDRSGNNNHGDLLPTGGDIASPRPGKIGQALSFNNVNARINYGDIQAVDDASTLSGCAWVFNNQTGDREIMTKVDGGLTAGFYFLRDDLGSTGRTNIYRIIVYDSADTDSANLESASSTSKVGVWTHVCFTFVTESSSGLRLYINGQEDPNSPVSTVGIGAINAGTNTFFAPNALGTPAFNGMVDDVRLYGRVLSAAEISRLYQSTQSKLNTSTDLLKNGLVGCWSFDGSYTKVPDCSGNNNTGTITGAAKVMGKIGQALDFDGVDDVVQITDPGAGSVLDFADGTSITMAAWIRPDNQGTCCQAIVQKFSGGAYNYGLQLFDGRFGFFYYNGPLHTYDSTPALGPGQWSHIAFTYTFTESTTAKLYLNGSPVGGGWGTGNGNDAVAVNDGNIEMGTNGFNEDYPGLIDDVRIYNRALSAGEIQKLYNMGR